MKIMFFTVILFITFANLFSEKYADNKKSSKKDKEEISYRIKSKFPIHVYNVYEMTDVTTLKRVYFDSSEVEFKREVTYYYTVFAPNNPVDGMHTVEVSIDSMKYKYTQGNLILDWVSTGPVVSPSNYADCFWQMTPLSKEFDATFTAYGEMASVGGEKLQGYIDRWLDPKWGIQDSARRARTLNRVSLDDLKTITDHTQGLLPAGEVTLDTTWKNEINYNLNFIKFRGEGVSKIASFKNQVFELVTICDNLKADAGLTNFDDVTKEGLVENGKASGNFAMTVSATGNVEKLAANIKATVNGKIGNATFTQSIDNQRTWKQIKRYKY